MQTTDGLSVGLATTRRIQLIEHGICDQLPAYHSLISLIIDRVAERASAFVLWAPAGDATCADPLFTNR